MDEENKKPVSVQKMKWTTAATFDNFAEARARADAVKGKVKKRPNGKFDVRVGQEVKAAKPQEEQS